MQSTQQPNLAKESVAAPSHGFWIASYVWLSILSSVVVIGLAVESTPLLHWVQNQVLLASQMMESTMASFYGLFLNMGVNPNQVIHQLQQLDSTPFVIPTSMLVIYSLLSAINIIGCLGMWYWRKWGVYGVYVSMLLGVLANYYTGFSVVSFFFTLLNAYALYAIVRGPWKRFA
ncbi:hypothetical protein M9194_05030 [Vibrio sp. S4M6]|uniref:hypothetical protein n=1 Tax=Vibrio sinus TaxID=2946865 RepID=UPI00202A5FFF|nr:hypothetical protein [Vibrio sinus]MCL9780802.1 hypothetical protein [Vibrio sinus]